MQIIIIITGEVQKKKGISVNNAIRLKLAKNLAAARGIKVTTQDGGIVHQNNDKVTIEHTKNDTPHPISNAQERMWFLHQLDPSSSAYNVCILWHLEGELDVSILQKSCIQLVQRHSIFRTKYFSDQTIGAKQVIVENFPPDWSEENIQDLNGAEQNAKLQVIAQHASTAPFDLAHRSTLRLVLVKMNQTKHVLVMVGQHIVWDGPSFSIFSKDLAAYYNGFKSNTPVEPPPLPIQYIDFAQWHRQKWQSESPQRKEQIAFWQAELNPLPESIDFPIDFPRQVIETEEGGWCTQGLDKASTSILLTLAAEEQVTVFEVIVSVIALLMTRLARASEITIGTVASHRNLPELKDLIGNFGNVVPLRISIDNQSSFRQLLQHSAKRCRNAFSHADLPFELLLEQLQVQRGQARNPLLDTMVTFLSHGMSSPHMDDLQVSWSKHFNGTTQTDLSFDALLNNGSLQFQATWRTSLYKPETVPNHLKRLTQLIKHCLYSPDISLANISMTLPNEDYLSLWGQRPAIPISKSTLVDWFEQTTQKHPNNTALILLEGAPLENIGNYAQNITFSMLNQQANQIAHWLIAQNVGPENRVAIILERRLEWFAVMLGILKSGAAFIPVDPNYPEDYIKRVLKLSTAKIIITEQNDNLNIKGKYDDILSSTTQILTLSDIKQQTAKLNTSDHNPTNSERTKPLQSLSPACITFTSGSTGEPKGVVVPHSALINLISSHKHDLYNHAQAQTKRSQLKIGHAWSLAFDAAWQPCLWMFEGHQLYLFSSDLQRDPVFLAKHIMLQKMDFIELTPGMLEEILPWLQSGLQEADGQFVAAHIPAILGFGGESVKQELWQNITQLENTTGFNLYGPTEATVDAMISRVDIDTKPNIGGPVAGAQVYVLDSCLQLAPFGIPGELAISGNGLARGYLSRSDLTASKFIANPYGKSGSRLYLTGDRVRWIAEGQLEYIGRIDEQVKIRGFRVEPLEVESNIDRLIQLPCAVIARQVSPSGMQLICFIENQSLTNDSEERKHELISIYKAKCEKALPSHLLPKYFVLLPKLPRLPNGKTNRRALPTPEGLDMKVKRPARNKLEKQLCDLICEVLAITEIGIDDGFFEMGGDSISVVKLVSRARRENIHLTPRQIFNTTCVANLAKELTLKHNSRPSKPLLKHDNNDVGVAKNTPLMQRYFDTDIPLDKFAQIVSLPLPQDMSVKKFQVLLTTLVNRHAMLGAQLINKSPDQICLDIPSEHFNITYCSECYMQEKDGNYYLYSEHSNSALDTKPSPLSAKHLAQKLCGQLAPQKGKMLAAYLLKERNTNKQTAWVAINHLVIDTSSWHILSEDLATAWTAQVKGLSIDLPPVPTSWRSWAACLPTFEQKTSSNLNHTNTHTKIWYLQQIEEQCPAELIAQRHGIPLANLVSTMSCLAAIKAGLVPDTQISNIALLLEQDNRKALQQNQDLSRTIGLFSREISIPLDTQELVNEPNKLSNSSVIKLLRQWCGEIIQRDVVLSADKSNTPSLKSWQLGFSFLGDHSMPQSSEFWSATPLSAILEQPSLEQRPLLHAIDINAYYTLKSDKKALCFNAIAPTGSITKGDLDRFFDTLNQLFHNLSATFTDEVQYLAKSDLLFTDGIKVLAATPLQSEMLSQSQAKDDPWTTQMEVTISSSNQFAISENNLKAGASRLLSRNDALRAGFFVETSSTFIADELEPVWQSVDLRSMTETRRQELLIEYRKNWYSFRFNFQHPPLLRFLSIHMQDNKWLILVHCHHLLLDGWSLPRSLQDWLNNTDNKTLPQPKLTWEQYLSWLQKQDPTCSWRYWNKALTELKQTSLLCPQRKERTPSIDISKELPLTLHQGINSLAASINVSPAILFQWAWANTLAKALNQNDIVFGLFDSGRSVGPQAIDSLVGLVTQLVPLRVKTTEKKNIIQQLQTLQTQQFEWQALPPPRLDNLEASHKFGEFFDSLLVIENALNADDEAITPSSILPNLHHIKWQDSVGQAAALFVYPSRAKTSIRLCFDPVALEQKLRTQLLTDFEFYLQQLNNLPRSKKHKSSNTNQSITSSLTPTE